MTIRRSRSLAVLASVAAVLGLLAVAPSGVASAADGNASSAVTVKWRGGNDPDIQKYQTDHAALSDGNGNDGGSGHWDDFKNLSVTVSQTKNLTDQVVSVDVSGMAATFENFGGAGVNNYLQLMQCWGADPLATDFTQTCQFGSYSAQAGASNASTKALRDAGGSLGVTDRGAQGVVAASGLTRWGEVFRSVGGTTSEAVPSTQYTTQVESGIGKFFTATSSNEQPLVGVYDGLPTRVHFETQSSAAQPYLGCGTPAAPRCWLVVVPRGVHSGTLRDAPVGCSITRADENYTVPGNVRGGETGAQVGSPIDPNCSFWQNRIVVPLDFQPTGSSCSAGAPERRVLGTDLVSTAMSSWQRTLCGGADAAVYSLTTNPGPIIRGQVLGGEAGLGLTLQPITADTVSVDSRELVDGKRLRYAPVANTGVAVAFVSEWNTRRVTDIKLTARLLAKILTMSYTTLIASGGHDSPSDTSYLGANPERLASDPEFQALNPLVSTFDDSPNQLLMLGPQGEDAVRAVWSYLQSDDKARTFLAGEPDENGMRINPYFLPGANPRALGGGLDYDLAKDPVDVFPKADQTLYPDKATADTLYNGQQIDATMMNPYVERFEAVAQRIVRGANGRTASWDAEKLNSAGDKGAWTSTLDVTRVSPGKQLLGLTDMASAERYGVSLATMQRPNSDEFVSPTDDSLRRGVTSSASDGLDAINLPGAANTPSGGYPLTTTIYAAADIDSVGLDDAARTDYARFLDYVASDGQTPGELAGQLPKGFVPLSDSQRAQTRKLASVIRDPGTRATAPGGDTPVTNAGPGSNAATQAPAATGQSPSSGTKISATPASASESTGSAIGSIGLGGALVAGLAGLVASPFLLRRRSIKS